MATKHPHPPRLAKDEWDFSESRIPKDELRLCCAWEYMRETLLEREERARFVERYPERKLNRKERLLIRGQPWVRLSPAAKERYTEMLRLVWERRERATPLSVVPKKSVLEGFQHETAPDSEWASYTTEDSLQFHPDGFVRATLQIDFGNHRDTAIREEFARLLAGWRDSLKDKGKLFREPTVHGPGSKDDDVRTQLKRLSTLRLRHVMSIGDIITLLSPRHDMKFWSVTSVDDRLKDVPPGDYRSEIEEHIRLQLERHVRGFAERARMRLLQDYRALFPDLGLSSYPQHWEPFTTYTKPP